MVKVTLAQTEVAAVAGSNKITGRIIDSITSQPIDYASISLMNQADDKVINGGTTDSKGNFKLNDIADGHYKIVVYFIGYSTTTINNLVLNKTNSNVGDIKLASKRTTLKTLTIVGDKNIIENKIDKTVYNVEKDITSQSGVAADVLKKVPQVAVDVDGNVELQGNTNVRFLINGKPSTIFGNNIADVLQSIPASQIKSIEVITSPGAKYDAQGTGGIINIILKKSTAQGINGNVSLSGGSRLENGSVNLNIRHGHFGVNAFMSGNAQLNSTTLNTMNRLSKDSASTVQLNQDATTVFRRGGYQSGLGFDWDLNDKNSITGSFSYDYFGVHNVGVTNRQTITQDFSGNTLSNVNDVVNTTNLFHLHSLDGGLNYKKTFKTEEQVLELSYNSSYSNTFPYYQQAQSLAMPYTLLSGNYGNSPGTEHEMVVAANYTQPLGKEAVLETGAQATSDHLQSTSNVYLLNNNSDSYSFSNTQSNSFDYTSNVYAAYLSTTFKWLKALDIKTGIRDEYTDIKANVTNSGNVLIKPYNTVVPSVVFSHTFKTKETLKLSYSHRIQRPEFRDLNPFINAADPKNISTGNPNLKPEVGDKIELGFDKNFEKGGNLTTTLFYRGNRNDIQPYTKYYSTYAVGDSTYNNVAVSIRENIGREDNFGLNLFASIPVKSKLNLRSNVAMFERYITNGTATGDNIHGFNYRINLNATYTVNNTLTVEAFGNFNSQRINVQGKMPSFTTYNFAVRKQIFHKKGSIAFTTTNPFNKYVNQQTELTGENFTMANLRQLPYRSFGINFTYKFGKLEFKKDKEPEDINLTNSPSSGG